MRYRLSTLDGKQVLVIGGSSGIGYSAAAGALEQGAIVTIASRSEEKLRRAKAGLHDKVKTRPIDVGDTNSVNTFFDDSPVYDHIVISGASTKSGPMRELSLEDAYASMNSKFWGPYRVVRRAQVAPGGSFVFVSGFYSKRPRPNVVANGAINAAIEAMALGLAVEMAPVRFNVVSPGIIDTPLRDAMPAEARKALLESVAKSLPVKRVGTGEDLADQILLLMRNTFATGTVIYLDGGGSLV